MCWFLSQLTALWQNRHTVAVDAPDGQSGAGAGEGGADAVAWRPWEHIQPHPKGTPAPQVNPSGKYCVRLYWMVSMKDINWGSKVVVLQLLWCRLQYMQ